MAHRAVIFAIAQRSCIH